jgi:hypothetical protein
MTNRPAILCAHADVNGDASRCACSLGPDATREQITAFERDRIPKIDWQAMPVHPAAEMLPMMGDAELKELAADIKANGLQEPIILWRDNTKEAKRGKGPFPLWLLDGRNRLAALKLLGIDDPNYARSGKVVETRVRVLDAVGKVSVFGGRGIGWRTNVDPVTFVLSMNVHRRHLTTEQKRQAIAAFIKADPTTNNSKVARDLHVSDHTVADVRADQNSRSAKNDHLPIERAKRVLCDDPTLTNREAATLAGVSVGTVSNARKQMAQGRAGLEGRSEIPNVSERTDSVGRQQPARKPRRKPEPVEAEVVVPPGGVTDDTPGMTDRVKETLRIVKAGAGEPVEPPPETASVAEEPDPDDNDAELDIAALLCGVTAKLDALADYVAGLEADGRRGVFYDHKDAVPSDDLRQAAERRPPPCPHRWSSQTGSLAPSYAKSPPRTWRLK